MRPEGAHPVYWRTFFQPPPKEWGLKPFRELASNFKGKLPSVLSAKQEPGWMPYLLVEGFEHGTWSYTSETNLPQVTEADSVVVADGSRSGWALHSKAGALGSTLLCYRPKEGVDSDYLYYLLQSFFAFTNTATIGGAVPHLDTRLLDRLKIYLPVREKEQATIAKRLKAVDEAITSAETKLTAARRLKTALMQQLFTRGIPGRHKRFKQTKIGEIPEEWDLIPLGSLSSIVSGFALNTDRAPRFNPRQYLTVIHVQRERIDLTDVRYMEVFKSELPAALLEEGDILVVEGHANAAEIGRAAIATNEVAGFTYQNHLFRVRLSAESALYRQVLLCILNSERVRRHWVATCNTSSGLNTINRRSLRKLLIQCPEPKEQEQIAMLISDANNTIEACETELLAVQRLKKALLQNLLTGRVRVGGQ